MAIVKHLITTDEYDRMVAAGAFHPEARLELIHGEIVEMTPIGSDHQSAVDRLNDVFTSRLGRRAIVRVQGPVRAGRHSEPQPDILLLERREDYYRTQHPGPAAVLLVIEVAESSLAYDRDVKLPLYIGEGIREYWIVNLVDGVLEVYRAAPGGTEKLVLTRGQSVAPLAFPDLVLRIDELLG